jgi:hypothetical protein
VTDAKIAKYDTEYLDSEPEAEPDPERDRLNVDLADHETDNVGQIVIRQKREEGTVWPAHPSGFRSVADGEDGTADRHIGVGRGCPLADRSLPGQRSA